MTAVIVDIVSVRRACRSTALSRFLHFEGHCWCREYRKWNIVCLHTHMAAWYIHEFIMCHMTTVLLRRCMMFSVHSYIVVISSPPTWPFLSIDCQIFNLTFNHHILFVFFFFLDFNQSWFLPRLLVLVHGVISESSSLILPRLFLQFDDIFSLFNFGWVEWGLLYKSSVHSASYV